MKAEKTILIDHLLEKVNASPFLFVVDYTGLTVDKFTELRKRYRGFVFPATVAFLAWYLLYVVMSNWAGDFMSITIVGNINVALVFGLLQFATTFGLAWYYSRFSRSRLDPLARQLEEDYRAGAGADGRRGQA